jgi:hypothetical protein
MGRQLQLATTRADEAELLRFIASLAPVRRLSEPGSHARRSQAPITRASVLLRGSFTSGPKLFLGRPTTSRLAARTVRQSEPAFSISPTCTQRQFLSYRAPIYGSGGLAASTGVATSPHHMGSTTTAQHSHALSIPFGGGFARLAGAFPPIHTHLTICPKPRNSMQPETPNPALQRTRAPVTPAAPLQPPSPHLPRSCRARGACR